ncbi:hypothetical protein DRQ27_03025 [bacterium]|nr:MAG: hypothetical protein DRQ27_03025 [bacterium]
MLEAFEKAGKPLKPGDMANLIELLIGWGWASTKIFCSTVFTGFIVLAILVYFVPKTRKGKEQQ